MKTTAGICWMGRKLLRTLAACAGLLLLVGVTAVGQPKEEGLILHYTFDEAIGNGRWLPDRSGHGFTAFIGGPIEWVKERNRKVLRFGGRTHLEVGKEVGTLIGQSGTLETWCLPEEIRGGLIAWNAGGVDSADQRLALAFYTYQTSTLCGMLADGVNCTHNSLHYPVEKGKWNHLAMTFNGTNLRLFVNGELVKTGSQAEISPRLQDVPLRIGWIVGFDEENFNFVGKMAEVRVYKRALSAEEIGRHFAEGLKQLGVEIPPSVSVTTRLEAKRSELTALCDLTRITNLPGRSTVSVTLRDANKKVLQEKTAQIPPNATVVSVVFPTASLTAGLYEVSVSVKDTAADKVVAELATTRWYLPEVAQLVGAPPGRKILNNLVTQLTVVDNLTLKDYQEVSFVNPRKGWVFVSATAQVADLGVIGLITVGVDGEKKESAIASLAADKPTMETMRLLSAGEHKLCIWSEPGAGRKQSTITRLVVRAVPAMMYCGWPGGSSAGYGDYDFAFLKRDVLPNINTLVGAALSQDQDRDEWHRRGRQCLQEMAIPTRIREVLKDVPIPMTGDYAYGYWAKCAGLNKSNMNGSVNDEFGGGEDPDFPGYTEGVKRIAADPAFKDRVVHMWGGPVMALSSLSRDFVRAVVDSGYKIAWEEYLVEDPTIEETRKTFDGTLRHGVTLWEQAFPGFVRNAIIVLSVLSAPPESGNINPSVDYKVFLDMQYQHLASSPEFLGLWGVMLYKATYADEEDLRWAGRLFRHYCIEGNTDLLSEQYGFTFNLRHIRNPDFDDGFTGWQVSAAEQDSVRTGHMYRLHGLLNRYHGGTEGNNFLLMKRSGQKPNRVSQEITGLKAGQYYSMKMFAADHQDLVQAKSEKKRLTVSVNIENAELTPAKTVISEIKGYQPVAQYKGKEPPYMNFHRYVFRAKGPTARLTISDWVDPSTGSGQATPGGPVGQETLVNFIEIQPYLED